MRGRSRSSIIWVCFGAFCLGEASLWLIAPWSGGPSASLSGQAIWYLLAGGVCCGLRAVWGWRGIPTWRIAAAGVLVLGSPVLVRAMRWVEVSDVDATAMLGVVPLLVVLGVAWRQAAESSAAQRRLSFCLVGWCGLLYLLPVQIPGSAGEIGGVLAVLGSAGMVALGSVWLHELLRGVRIADALSILIPVQGLVFSVAAFAVGEWHGATSGLLEGPKLSFVLEMLLVAGLVWLVREMAPVELASRFLAVPLVTVLEGVVMLRPEMTVRLMAGCVLGASGVIGLLITQRDEETRLNLRGDFSGSRGGS